MKRLLLAIPLFSLGFIHNANAQEQVEQTKTYYDSKKVKEIYHHKQVVKMMPDKKHYGEYIDTMYFIKSGPYTYYFESGNVQQTGFYNDEKKDSVWKYYDEKGKLLKTELYRRGQLVK